MVTQTGRPGVVFNGVADWVYEEEVRQSDKIGTNLSERVQVLSDTRAIWFSPDGDKIAWTQFNDTDVSIRNVVMLIILEIINDNENYIPNFNMWIFFVVWDDMLKCNEISWLITQIVSTWLNTTPRRWTWWQSPTTDNQATFSSSIPFRLHSGSQLCSIWPGTLLKCDKFSDIHWD